MKLHDIPKSWLEYASQHSNSYQTWLWKLTVHVQHGINKWEVDIGLSIPGTTELCMLVADTHREALADLDWIIDEIAIHLAQEGGYDEP